jgi:hypothetical protein
MKALATTVMNIRARREFAEQLSYYEFSKIIIAPFSSCKHLLIIPVHYS